MENDVTKYSFVFKLWETKLEGNHFHMGICYRKNEFDTCFRKIQSRSQNAAKGKFINK